MLKRVFVLMLAAIFLFCNLQAALASTSEVIFQAGNLVWQEGDPPGLEGFEYTFSWSGIACYSYRITIVAEDDQRTLLEENFDFNQETSSFDLIHMDRWASDAADGRLWDDTFVFTLELLDDSETVVYTDTETQVLIDW